MHFRRFTCRRPILIPLTAALSVAFVPAISWGQVRSKKPDRGVYQSPQLSDGAVVRANESNQVSTTGQSPDPRQQAEPRPQASEPKLADLLRADAATREHSTAGDSDGPVRDLVAAPLTDARAPERATTAKNGGARTVESREPITTRGALTNPIEATNESLPDPTLQRVSHNDVILAPPTRVAMRPQETVEHTELWTEEGDNWSQDTGVIHDSTCDGCPDCDLTGCDSLGCDSMGSNRPWYAGWANSSIGMSSDRWFGNVELMLMFRKGFHPPILVTSTTDATPDPDTAGEIGQPETVVLAGVSTILKDMQSGGRLTLGTWLDRHQCRSLVTRLWFAGDENYSFNTNQDLVPVITRPFFNVSDNQTPTQDTQLIAFPGRVSGQIRLSGTSEVYGGDISVRQFLYGKYGGTIDFLYGYQYMRLRESLSISNLSTSLNDDFAPVGTVISVADVFRTTNEFHGAQIGIATRYREGCWSFNGLLKTGFGSLRRQAHLNGSTFTAQNGAEAVDPNGLLVRSTNSGTTRDSTFGWTPELDLSIGWQPRCRFDVTVGYHIIGMTDSLQPGGAIDPNLAVNLSDPPTGQQRPTAALRYNTFYVQGIHFGTQYRY